MNRFLYKIKQFNKIAEIDEIARRYFALNSFDGVLMILGIIIANFFASIADKKIILVTSIGAMVAVTISGMWGAYLTEHAERTGEIKKLEKKVGLSFRKTPIHHAHIFATISLSLINGLSSLFAALIIISPFFFSFIDIKIAYYIAISLAFLILFLLGVFLGKISKSNLIVYGIKLILAGIVCSIIIFLIEHVGALF